jgi:hypothetical protein
MVGGRDELVTKEMRRENKRKFMALALPLCCPHL